MFRIAHYVLVALIGALIFLNLIAARPLPTAVEYAQLQPVQALTPTPNFPTALPPPAMTSVGSSSELPLQERPAGARPPEQALLAALSEGPRKALTPPWIPGNGPWMHGELVAQTERIDFYIGNRTFKAEQIKAIAPLIEQLLRDAELRLGTTLNYRVSLGFYRLGMAPNKRTRGLAFTSEGRAELYYNANENLDRAATVAAHELGHHLEIHRYGEDAQRRADTILHEGLATWVVGQRWMALNDASSWRERARQLRNAGVPLRLRTAEQFGANNAYDMWASFVDFLIKRYGMQAFDALYSSGRGHSPGSANYQAVYGKSLEELADEWRAWVGE